jgi:hypothetical protein
MDLTKNCSQMGKQFLPLIRHPLWYSYSQYMLKLLLHLVDVIRNNKCIVIKLWINNLQVDTDDHNDNMLQKKLINRLCSAARPEERQGVMYSCRVYRMVEEWTTYMRLLSWRRHQGTMANCSTHDWSITIF